LRVASSSPAKDVTTPRQSTWAILLIADCLGCLDLQLGGAYLSYQSQLAVKPCRFTRWRTPSRSAVNRNFSRLPAKNRPSRRPPLSLVKRQDMQCRIDSLNDWRFKETQSMSFCFDSQVTFWRRLSDRLRQGWRQAEEIRLRLEKRQTVLHDRSLQ